MGNNDPEYQAIPIPPQKGPTANDTFRFLPSGRHAIIIIAVVCIIFSLTALYQSLLHPHLPIATGKARKMLTELGEAVPDLASDNPKVNVLKKNKSPRVGTTSHSSHIARGDLKRKNAIVNLSSRTH